MIATNALCRLAIFENVPQQILAELAEHVTRQTFEPNDIIVRQHDDAQCIFLLLKGKVQFLIEFQGVDDMLVGTTSAYGAPIGWSVAREPHRYTATVRCEEQSEMLCIPKSSLNRIVRQYPEVGFDILRHLAVAIATRLEQARDFLVQPANISIADLS
ncbi:MAG: cyclic nucleotide-binding domain-containing protein [Methyloligellaceae bacterium]